MSRAGEPEDTYDAGNARDYRARGMASEAQQALRSHESLTNLQFEHMETKLHDLKEVVDATCTKVDELSTKVDKGFSAFNNRIITLLISIVFLLVSGLSVVVFYLLTKGSS